MNHCTVSLETLAEYRAERLTSAQAAKVGAHVSTGCARCAAHLEFLTRALPSLGATFDAPPAAAVERATRAVRNVRAERMARHASPREVLGQLIRGAGSSQPAFARDAGAETWGRLYTTLEQDVDVWGERQGDRYYLIGQVRRRADGAALWPRAVSLLPQDGDGIPFAALPEAAEFHLPGVPPGTYTLRVLLGEGDTATGPASQLVLPDLVVGEA